MTDMSVANTILDQIGGRKFIAMTGASSFAGSANSLSFRIPQNNKGRFGGVRIELTPDDLYRMTFVRLKKVDGFTSYDNVEHAGVYFDQLQ